jgi:hypothetical protein
MYEQSMKPSNVVIWGNDGWCYTPELKTRHRYTEKGIITEKWDGVIAMPEHIA